MSKIILKDISTRAPKDFDKSETKERLVDIKKQLAEWQNIFYANGEHSLLVVIQGMDGSGKDGAIRNVFTSMNPQGVYVRSFKVPTAEEMAHDFLWRIHKEAPAKGQIGIFNRSHYEDILVTRVHNFCDDELAKKRMQAINNFERILVEHNQTKILKFYLHISHEEQIERLQERKTNPQKEWKYNEKDLEESKLWDKYMTMYEDCFEQCNYVPWLIVPSDQNWFKEYTIAKELLKVFKGLKLKFPEVKQI